MDHTYGSKSKFVELYCDGLMGGNFATWQDTWQSLASYLLPSRSYITEFSGTPETDHFSRLFDMTGPMSLRMHAAGMTNFIHPAHERWVMAVPPKELENNDEAKNYYADFSDQLRYLLAEKSNAYSCLHEYEENRGCFGSAAIYVEDGEDDWFCNFMVPDVGTFAIAEDHRGRVNTICVEKQMTLRQMAERFGIENLPPQKAKTYQDALGGKNDKLEETFTARHLVCPRKERQPGSRDVLDKPFASYWQDKQERTILEEGGYDTFPYPTSRYGVWDRRMGPYGVGPGHLALPECRQLNESSEYRDYLAELAVFPRKLIPTDVAGTVQFGINGATYLHPEAWENKRFPTTWGENQGGIEALKDVIADKREQIYKAFSLDMFQLFANLEKGNMTATEVLAREAEKLVQFSATFDRNTSEAIRPMLQRVARIAVEKGLMPEPPDSVLKFERDVFSGDEVVKLREPRYEFTGRIALAQKLAQQARLGNLINLYAPINEMTGGAVFENFNWDTSVRDDARYSAIDVDRLVPEDERDARREERAKQQAMAQEAAMAEQLAGAAGKVVNKSDPAELANVLMGAR